MSVPTARSVADHAFRNAFVPFAGLVLWAYWAGEISTDPILLKTKFMIRASMALFVPAYVMTLFRSGHAAVGRHADAFWTFSGLAYLIHFYWAVFRHYGGFAQTIEGQGPPIAWGNFVLTAWWVLDIAWIGRSALACRQGLRFVFQTLILLTMLATALLRREGAVQLVAYGMIAVIGSALLLRLLGNAPQLPPATSKST